MPDGGKVSWQFLSNGGINPAAVQMVVESFWRSTVRTAFPKEEVSFELEGIRVTLQEVGEPTHAGLRKELKLP